MEKEHRVTSGLIKSQREEGFGVRIRERMKQEIAAGGLMKQESGGWKVGE